MEYGGYFVFAFFMLLLLYWGRRIGQSELPLLTKLLIISGLFVFFSLGGSRWQELWVLLIPQWALAIGFLLGVFPNWLSALPKPNVNRKHAEQYRHDTKAEIERQKEAALDDVRRQASQMEREASERLRREKQQAEEELRRETERVKCEADEKVKQAQDYARKQQRQAQFEKAKSEPDLYEVLGLKRGATKAEIKFAYRELVVIWHPDKVQASDEVKKLAEEKLKTINNAYNFLIKNKL